MRLTLRTLLAYLDDILESAQAKEIGQKAAESNFASTLINRIREVMRRRRLMAPDLDDSKNGLDPNVVAEYLDNTLSPDKVADVERVCLESDIHLAEVAACHQILTLVLGEPVEISPECRERMYALGPAVQPAAQPAALTSDGGEPVSGNGASPRGDRHPSTGGSELARPATSSKSFEDTIPDYLKPPPLWRRTLPYLVVTVLVAVWLGLFVIDSAPFSSFFSNATDPASPSGAVGDPLSGEDTGIAAAKSGLANPADESPNTQPDGTPVPEQDGPPSDVPGSPVASNGQSGAGDAEQRMTDAGSATAAGVDEPPVVSNTPNNGATVEAASQPDQAMAAVSPNTTAGANPLQPAPQKIDPAPAPVNSPIVQYTSQDGVLLRYEAEEDDWRVMPRRSIIQPGDRLACPEPFEAILRLGNGAVLVKLLGGTAVRLVGPSEIAPIGLEIDRGRIEIRRRIVGQDPPNAEAVLAVSVDGELWRLELLAADLVCGLEIVRREPGQFEQELGRDAYTGSLYVVQGGLRFADESGREQAITGRAWRSLTPGDRAAIANQDGEVPDPPLLAVPEWLDSESSRSSTTLRRFSGLFEKEFDPEQPMLFSIPAVVGSPRPQISELAAKCLALTARHAALVQTLATAEHDEARQAAILGLRIWLPRSVENRERLKEEMLQHFQADEAQIVYVLLWGYDDEDARNPTVSDQLVNWLTHDHIAIRELAFYHIYRLTGRTYFYRPYDPPMQRQSAIHRWAAHLSQRDGALVR